MQSAARFLADFGGVRGRLLHEMSRKMATLPANSHRLSAEGEATKLSYTRLKFFFALWGPGPARVVCARWQKNLDNLKLLCFWLNTVEFFTLLGGRLRKNTCATSARTCRIGRMLRVLGLLLSSVSPARMGRGERCVAGVRVYSSRPRQKTLTLTLSRSTGRGDQSWEPEAVHQSPLDSRGSHSRSRACRFSLEIRFSSLFSR
jgi:hypothetical protein